VTGANRGIGLEVCRQLAQLGHRVILTSRDAAKGETAAHAIGGETPPRVVTLDVADERSVKRAASVVLKEFGGVDIFVNNVAVLIGEEEEVFDVSREHLEATFQTNVFGAIAVAQAFVPGMIERRYGRVVNVSSTAGQLSSMNTYAPAYSMSKAALNAFTRQLAGATRGSGVLVNSACPGWVRTDMGGRGAPRSVAEGADTIVWLATLPDKGPTGKFFNSRRQIDW
jgi:NAD(P)-dependent dehydrogenase (short-subunit alcohol dehydrogenase family)